MSKFLPKMYQESIYTIDYKKLKTKKIKCILFDLDNTCVPFYEHKGNTKLKKLFEQLTKMGFKVIIFSNSPKRRLDKFKDMGVEYNYSSKKPLKYEFNKIIKKYNYQKEEIIIVGDQIFTDIFGGNRVGINTCLVDPLTNYDGFLTRITRKIERIKLNDFEKKGILKRGEYYDKM